MSSTITAGALVDQLAAVGEWPSPQLLEEILSVGDAAVDPLIELLRQDLRGWPEEAPICFAAELLGAIGATRAIPELIHLYSRYDNESLESIDAGLILLGPEVVELALTVVRNESISCQARWSAAHVARATAGDDPVWRPRVLAALREVLSDCIRRCSAADQQGSRPSSTEDGPEEHLARAGSIPSGDELLDVFDEDTAHDVGEFVDDDEHGEDADQDFDSEDEHVSDELAEDDDEAEDNDTFEIDDVYSLVTGMVVELSDAADPDSKELLYQAFDAKLVDEWFIDRDYVETAFRRAAEGKGGAAADRRTAHDWLSDYRRRYNQHVARQLAEARREAAPREDRLEAVDRGVTPPASITVRSERPKTGRNDPCWCGSGKKYKKCHLRQDQAELP